MVRKARTLCAGLHPLSAALPGYLCGDPVFVGCQLSDLCRDASGRKPGGVYPHGAEHVVFAVLFAGKPVSETQGVRVFVGGRAPAGAPPVPTDRTHSLRRDGAGDGCATPDRSRYIPAAVRAGGRISALCGTGGRKERMSHADALFHGVPAADKQPAETGACRKKDLPHPGASGHPGAGLFAGERKVQRHRRGKGGGDPVQTDGRLHDPAGIHGDVRAGAGERRQPGFAGTLQKEQRRFVLSELF